MPELGADRAIHGGAVRVAGYATGVLVSLGAAAILVRHLGIEAPELFAGARVEREHIAPRRREIQDAVDVERRRFLAAIQRNIGEPREA